MPTTYQMYHKMGHYLSTTSYKGPLTPTPAFNWENIRERTTS